MTFCAHKRFPSFKLYGMHEERIHPPLHVLAGTPACVQAHAPMAPAARAGDPSQALFIRHVRGVGGQPREDRKLRFVPGQVRNNSLYTPTSKTHGKDHCVGVYPSMVGLPDAGRSQHTTDTECTKKYNGVCNNRSRRTLDYIHRQASETIATVTRLTPSLCAFASGMKRTHVYMFYNAFFTRVPCD